MIKNGNFQRYRSARPNSSYTWGITYFGPKRLPELGESIGKMIREFKKSVSGIESESDETKNIEDKKEDK